MRRLAGLVVLFLLATAAAAAAAPGDRILIQRDVTLPVAGQPPSHLRIQLKDDFVRTEPPQRALVLMVWVRDSYGRYETYGGDMADEDYADFTIRRFTVRPVGSRAI